MKLKDIDIKILKIINEEGKKSYREIGGRLDVSPATIHNRITKMEENNMIKRVSTIINLNGMGYSLNCIIKLETTDPNREEWMQLQKNIISIYKITGEYNLLLLCKFKDFTDLNEFTDTLTRKYSVKKIMFEIITDVLRENVALTEIDEEMI